MPKFAKRFLIALAALVALGGLALLCTNIYLQSSTVQQRIRESVARQVGTDVKIRSTSYTPWSGLVLRNIEVPDPISPSMNILEAKALRIRFSFLPLFNKRFVIYDCSLYEPTLIVRQLANGDWMAPLPAKIKEVEPAPVVPGAPTAPRVVGAAFKCQVERLRLIGGTVAFLDAKNRTVLMLESVDIDANISDNVAAAGVFDIGETDISGYLHPRKVGGPFTWDGEVLDLPQIKGALAGGEITGSYHLVALGDPRFDMNFSVKDARLKKLFAEAHSEPGKTDGNLVGQLRLSGDPRFSESTTGSGHFELLSAKLKPVDFLIKLGELLQIEELQLLQLKDAKMDITVKEEKIWVDNLTMQSENLILKATGPVRFNGKMDLAASLLVNRKLQQQLRGVLGKNFVKTNDPEYQRLDFNVTGHVDSPKTDLLDKLIGINIGQDIGGMLKSLFRGQAPKKEKGEK
ncbi:MAG: hypothetical protein BGO12_17960 [Verrucomicrobia bacterium 61-8]|nr:hypothetical protein [Verrucomicrobiota bacterium]OJV03607.1 MAG: hypothetical protein BGO12_17960 [Verrucomicrobia bacterium 61-8]